MAATFHAGAARRIITPDLTAGTVYLAGFQVNRRATEVHDDLYVRALAIRADEAPESSTQPLCFILVVCDLIGILHADVLAVRQAVQERGIDPSALIIAATHVHSGPDTIGLWGPSRWRSGVSAKYQAFLRGQIVEAVIETVSDLRPAHLCAGTCTMEGWLKNARRPEVLDSELSVLRATTVQGDPVFTLVNLACHPEVMFGENTAITADYAGAACQAVEESAGGTALFASADLGGMMTPDVSAQERTFETVEAMGRDVALAALSAVDAGRDLEWHSPRFFRREVTLPLENPLFRFAIRIGLLPSLTRNRNGDVVSQVSLLDLGPLRLVGIPGELLPRPGVHLRCLLGVPYRFLIGLADDELGYLLPSGDFVYPRNPFRPGHHYEETMSVSRYATPLLMEAWVGLLADAGQER
jgi:hypothetical protein